MRSGVGTGGTAGTYPKSSGRENQMNEKVRKKRKAKAKERANMKFNTARPPPASLNNQ